MIQDISIEEYFCKYTRLPIIDVRSPKEYEKGHIPEAFHIPLFSDEERAEIGTIYKQKSKEKAIKLAYKYVEPKLDWYVAEAEKYADQKNIVVHCWRGGMRSHSFASHLSENGFTVYVIKGGYKAFRNYLFDFFSSPMKLNVIGGYTGSGKTEILKHIKQLGHQVVDLEKIAHHKGSAFGSIGEEKQPTVEQFENNLFQEFYRLNLSETIWLEDESHNIGGVKIPMQLFKQMRESKVYFLDIPKEERAKFLVTQYTVSNNQDLADAIVRIERRLGGGRVKTALSLLNQNKYYEVALIALKYYDKSYLKGTNKRNQQAVIDIKLPNTNHEENAHKIIKYINEMNNIKLTQYSHGAGCGCKISPQILSTILQSKQTNISHPHLLVGNKSRDDAAVYDMGNGEAVISTTDFFMPIVDDAFTFGKIAATNAISDVYAMGGTPLLAIAILGWPVDKLSAEVAQQVLDGGRSACLEAGIPLAGGHSIDSPEPIFGLAVTGRVDTDKLKRNDTATEGCKLILTKPLGVGILTTAQKQGKLLPAHENIAPKSMMTLNNIGEALANISGVKALTDVTGFGLLGHLVEMCEGSKLSARIQVPKIPVFPEIYEYIKQDCIPGGTHRNWSSYSDKVQLENQDHKFILADPQTSGGLMIAVTDDALETVTELLAENNIEPVVFGELVEQGEKLVYSE